MHDIPLIDLSAPAADVERGIEAACRDVGFMYVAEHGIDAACIDAVRAAVVRYFSRAQSAKDGDCITRNNYRGYIPLGFFSPNDGSQAADAYEGYKLHAEVAPDDPITERCELYGPNRWPDDSEDLQRAVSDYWQACDRLNDRLLRILARILGCDEAELAARFEQPLTNMTLLHYPPQKPATDGFGIHPHKDTDALTILAPDPVGGLMVRPRGQREWLEAAPPAGALIVNLGDLLELWSGGYFVSTPHKVVNTSGAERYSFPYFSVPRFDTVVTPLREPVTGFERADVHVGDVSREVWRTNWPDTMPDRTEYDLGTLAD